MGSKQPIVNKTCSVCKTRSVFKCVRCKKAYYCSKEHQKSHWKEHRFMCKPKSQTSKNKSLFTKTDCTTSQSIGPDDCFIDAMDLRCYDELKASVEKALEKVGVCVVDNYIHEDIAESILKETHALYIRPSCFRDPEFPVEKKPSNNHVNDEKSDHRDDKIVWITGREKLCEKINILVQSFDNLVKSIFLTEKISHKSHLQLACFPTGSEGYKLHVDNPNDNGRLLTTKYFCNANYDHERDGCVSRFYVNNCTKFIDVEPKFNRAVFYWSDKRVMHEVLSSKRDIFSLTSWYFTRPMFSVANQSDDTLMRNSLVDETLIRNSLVKNEMSVNHQDHSCTDKSISYNIPVTLDSNQFHPHRHNNLISTNRKPTSSSDYMFVDSHHKTSISPETRLLSTTSPDMATRRNVTLLESAPSKKNTLRALTPTAHYVKNSHHNVQAPTVVYQNDQSISYPSTLGRKLSLQNVNNTFTKSRPEKYVQFSNMFYDNQLRFVESESSRLFKPRVLTQV